MNTTADLKLLGVAQVNGRPLACVDCGNTFSLEVHKRSVFETAPAWVCCLSCGHGGEDQAVTTGLVDVVLANWSTRQESAERDVFTAQWRGSVMTGELLPTLDVHQLAGAAEAAYEGAAPEVKRWARAKKREVKGRVKAPFRLARKKTAEAAGNAAAAGKAAALTTAWTLQTGGAGPTTRNKSRCKVKGCRAGWLTIKTRVHSSTGRAQEKKVRCAVCNRAGQ